MPVAPMPGHELLLFLLQVSVLMAAALSLGRVVGRLGMPAVVGELSAGILLGPSLLARVAPSVSGWIVPTDAEQMHLLDAAGQLGVLLLVGVSGIYLDLTVIRRHGREAAAVGIGGLVVPLAMGVTLGWLFAGLLGAKGVDPLVFALFLGVAMGVSAIPVIARVLIDMRMLHRTVGQITLAAGTVDDALGWILLSVVSALATTGLRAATSLRLVLGLVSIMVALVIGRPLVRAVLRCAARSTEPGPLAGAAACIILIGALATQSMGLEAVLGAFVAGVLVGSAAGPELGRLAPLRTVTVSVLGPLFFATAGLRMDLTRLSRPWVLLAGVAVLAAAIVGKFLGVYAAARVTGLGHWHGLALGAGLNARGVVEVVVAMVGMRLGILDVAAYTIVVLVAIVTSVMAPPILRLAMARIEQTAEEETRGRVYRLPATASAALGTETVA